MTMTAIRRMVRGGCVMATIRYLVGAERGSALITALIMLTVMSFFMVGFQSLNNTELGFGQYSRGSMLALDVAEAGIQEGIKRLNMYGAKPGSTCFVNSLTSGTCAATTSSPNTNTVVYQATMSSDSAIFPILSIATVNGATRAVRIFEAALFKSGFDNVILAPQVTFQGDASPLTGDTYSGSSMVFASYAKSPAPGTGATATNLVSPQILAATNISSSAGGPSNPGPFTFECASNSTTEVAPTPCPGGRSVDGNANTIPINWHPMTPMGMSATDITALIEYCTGNSCAPFGISMSQATQNGVGVTYTPVTYTPSYWSHPPYTGKVMLVVTTAPFCVNSTLGLITIPPCVGSARYYAGPATPSQPMRYLDWGLVQDDGQRGQSLTFYEVSACTAPCMFAGNPNGIRYIPLEPTINPTAIACNQNANPGTNVFDQINTLDGITCSAPITTINSTNVTFSGTKSNPESLVIDNAGGAQVHITGSIAGNGTLNCSNVNWDNYNWGMIFATGDIDIAANTVFKGFIYTPGNVYSHGTVLIEGGIFSNDDPGQGSQVNQVDQFGTVKFCGGAAFLITPQFYTFTTLTWQDRPGGQP